MQHSCKTCLVELAAQNTVHLETEKQQFLKIEKHFEIIIINYYYKVLLSQLIL